MNPYRHRVAVALFLLRNSCTPDVNDHYVGYVSAFFGFVRARVILIVDGETATLRWSDGTRLALHATRGGDRLVRANSRNDTLTFDIVDHGDTLRGAQYRTVQLPETWVRHVREPPISAPPRFTQRQPASSVLGR
jgi:hypothetical protein